MITNHDEITLERVRRFEEYYTNDPSRDAQDAGILYSCLLASLSKVGKTKTIRVKNKNYSSLTHSIFHQESVDSSVHNIGHKPDRDIRNMHRRSQMLKMSPSHEEDHLTNSPRPLESKTTLALYI